MPTRFTSLGIAGTATIATLIATTVTLTTLTVTTGTFTKLNFTSGSGTRLEMRPASGSGTISLKGPGTTNSGGLLCVQGGDGTLNVCAISGGLLDCNNFQSKVALCP
jgi:hypothetical protein